MLRVRGIRVGAAVLWCAGLTLVPARLPAQQSQVGNIIGEIQIARVGLPNKQIFVNLQSRGANINSAYADGEGRFGFYALPDGVYYLDIQDDDYVPVNQQVILNLAVSTTSFARITLTPRTKPNPAQPTRVTGSNPNVIDLADYTRAFPKKAVKEYEKGRQASAQGDDDGARKHFRKALDLAPDFYPAHNELGRVYVASSDFPSAEKEFREVIRLNQSDAEAHLNLANVLLLTKRYNEALQSVDEGLRRDPQSAFGHFVLGSLYERGGKFGEAEKNLREALKLDPSMSKVHLELVNLYLTQGKKQEASAELRTFLKDFPNDPFAPKAKAVLDRLNR
jgi:Tfp pilus assembly protein PilF